MSEVEATMAGEKSPEWWAGYQKCLADTREDKDYDAIAKRDQRIDRLVTLAGAIIARHEPGYAVSVSPGASVMRCVELAEKALAAIEKAVGDE